MTRLSILIIILLHLSWSNGLSQADMPVLSEDLPHFLEKVYDMDTISAPTRWSATAQETVTVYKDEGFTEIKGRAIQTKKYVYQGDEVIEEEIINKIVEGDYPDRKGKRGTFEGKAMPFSRETQEDYKYLDYGIIDLNSTEARKISFKSIERDDEHFDGDAYFDPITAKLLKMELTYADNPTAIKDWKATMTFTYMDGYRIMDNFDMDLRGGLLLFIRFYVRVQQHLDDIQILN